MPEERTWFPSKWQIKNAVGAPWADSCPVTAAELFDLYRKHQKQHAVARVLRERFKRSCTATTVGKWLRKRGWAHKQTFKNVGGKAIYELHDPTYEAVYGSRGDVTAWWVACHETGEVWGPYDDERGAAVRIMKALRYRHKHLVGGKT